MCISKITLLRCHRGMKSDSIHETTKSNKNVLEWSKANLFLRYEYSTNKISYTHNYFFTIRRNQKYCYDKWAMLWFLCLSRILNMVKIIFSFVNWCFSKSIHPPKWIFFTMCCFKRISRKMMKLANGKVPNMRGNNSFISLSFNNGGVLYCKGK